MSLAGAALALGTFLFFIQSDVLAELGVVLEESVFGYAAYVAILVASVVVAPITVLPIIPFAAVVFGPLTTALLSIVAWSIGAVIAFLIARYVGKPIVSFFIPIERLEALEGKLSGTDEFVGLLLLRMIVPVELLSYAVGLFTKVPLPLYTLVTILGVAPFSFIFSYGGAALASHSYGVLAITAVLGGLLFFLAARHYRDAWHW